MGIFISHRNQDKDIAGLIEEFLAKNGVCSDIIFCSSLPGNDCKEKISLEIKKQIASSKVDIVILSTSYYQSGYCLNEAGIVWYKDADSVVIGLPDIDDKNMIGFLNNEYKIRRLDNKSDILAIVEIIEKHASFSANRQKVDANIDKLISDYNVIIASRKASMERGSTVHDDINEDNHKCLNMGDNDFVADSTLPNPIVLSRLSDAECLLLQYCIDCDRFFLMAGWQINHELDKIKAWQEVNCLDNELSSKYEETIEKFIVRKFIVVSQLTNFNNPKEYRYTDEAFNCIDAFTKEDKEFLVKVCKKHFPF